MSRKVGGKTHGVGVGEEKQTEKPTLEANRYVAERKLGVGIEKVGGKTHGVGVGSEKQAEKPTLEANRYVAERKLGVGVEK